MISKENEARQKSKYSNFEEKEEEEEEEEELDPRIKCELERLNAATDGINHLETEFGEAQALFQQLMQDAAFHLKVMHQKLGKAVDKSRPYYEALKCAKISHSELHEAALKFEQAQTRHFNAKKLVTDTERIVFSSADRKLDPALQEMLNQATVEVMEAAAQSQKAWEVHRNASVEFEKKNKVALDLYDSLKKHIVKSRPYFDLKSSSNQQLDLQKTRLEKVQEGLQVSKNEYAKILHNLELISDDIHQSREMKRKVCSEMRGEGVGSESQSNNNVSVYKEVEKQEEKNNSNLFLNQHDNNIGDKENIGECFSRIGSQTELVNLGESLSQANDLFLNQNDENIGCNENLGESISQVSGPTELVKIRKQVQSLLETSAEQKSKNRLSQTERLINVNKTLIENCFDKSYDVITSHSIPFSHPQEEFVDSTINEYHNISKLLKKSFILPEFEIIPRRHTISGEKDSFQLLNHNKKLFCKSNSAFI